MIVKFLKSEALSGDTKTFWFKPEKPLRYTAGQFTELTLRHKNADERGEKRWFTLSSSPTEELLAITTKKTAHGSTYKQQLFNLSPGTSVTISEPMGDFVLPQDSARPLLFVAAGIGVTPMRSMVKWLTDKSQKRNIHLIHAVRKSEDLIFDKLFTSSEINYSPIVEYPSSSWHGESGKLNSGVILRSLSMADDSLVYISGPEPMVERFNAELINNNVPENRIVGDYFPGYPEI